jgi:hypothetical protein
MIRQFVAMPLGLGYTVEAQVTGREEFGGIQLVAYAPAPGRFPDEPPPERTGEHMMFAALALEGDFAESGLDGPNGGGEMGLAAGGQMEQKIYPDEYGRASWDERDFGRVYVHIVDSLLYRQITGEEPPPTPVTARTYAEHGFPWFALYDEARGDLAASETLAGVQSVQAVDTAKGVAPQQDDAPVDVPASQVQKLGGDPTKVTDGDW